MIIIIFQFKRNPTCRAFNQIIILMHIILFIPSKLSLLFLLFFPFLLYPRLCIWIGLTFTFVFVMNFKHAKFHLLSKVAAISLTSNHPVITFFSFMLIKQIYWNSFFVTASGNISTFDKNSIWYSFEIFYLFNNFWL